MMLPRRETRATGGNIKISRHVDTLPIVRKLTYRVTFKFLNSKVTRYVGLRTIGSDVDRGHVDPVVALIWQTNHSFARSSRTIRTRTIRENSNAVSRSAPDFRPQWLVEPV